MTEILEIPEVRRRISPLSVAEYHQLSEFNENGRRTELIRGLLIEKMSKSPLHVFLSDRLRQLLQGALPPDLLIRVESPLTFDDSEPEPDIAVVCGKPADFRYEHSKTAELVIEVAVSNPVLDRENAPLYAEAGVKEYWIILGERREVEVYRKPQAGQYAEKLVFDAKGTGEIPNLLGAGLRVTDIFSD